MKKEKRGRKNNKKSPCKSLCKESLSFLKESKNYIYFIIILFAISIIIGVFYQPENLTKIIAEYLTELSKKVESYNFIQLLIYILKTNITSSAIGLLLGIIFGIIPIAIIVINGYVLGFVSQKVVEIQGPLYLWKLLPHGIFELPAIFISMALGLRIGLSLFTSKDENSFKQVFKKSIKTFFFVIIPLLLIAGIIETILIFLVN